MSETESNYSPGLEGVIAGISGISQIDADNNVLCYRGYNVQDICDHASFEEAAFLLFNGDLPTKEQLASFVDSLERERAVPEQVWRVLAQLPPNSEPMDWLKVAVATLALFDPQAADNSHEANVAKALRLIAKMPSLVANGYRTILGRPQTEPKPGLSTAAQFLYLLNGNDPDPFFVKALNTTLILYAEHGFNASTFTARVTVSTLSDLYSGVVSAIGALKGTLHGGANEEVMHMLLEIGDSGNAEPWARNRLTKSPENPRPRIMGFGHREYKKGDQRALIVREYTRELGARLGDKRWGDISDILEKFMLEEKGLYPNLDFPVSPAYYLMGIPIPIYTPIFVVSRIVGWSAHIIEQLDNNRLIRPTNLYNGPERREFVPIQERS